MNAVRLARSPAAWVFAILLGSYAFFWHSRDWNSASRLMLTYALVDRGTVAIDGLDRQTGDIAFHNHHYYTDKLPGFSLLAVPPYALAGAVLGLPVHPLNRPGIRYWPGDYWITLATSGLLSAALGALLTTLSADLGCGPRRSALVGLAYGLATPAYVYATLAYGHQAAAFCLLASFAILWRGPRSPRRAAIRAAGAGLMAAWAAVIELQLGPVSAVIGSYLLILVFGHRWPSKALLGFTLGAAMPTAALLAYNQVAFGSPWHLGYFHEQLEIFNKVHSAGNPLGLRSPDWSKALPLLWGRYRGLLFYAPILILAAPGWIALFWRRLWGMAIVSALACLAIFLVNLSYPEWTGGWSTGPRLLVPLLPFAMLPVAGLLAVGGRPSAYLAMAPALLGGVLILLCQGVGARLPDKQIDPITRRESPVADPVATMVLPLWRGDSIPLGWIGDRFDRNLVNRAWPEVIRRLPAHERWVQFLPLIAFQIISIAAMARVCRRPAAVRKGTAQAAAGLAPLAASS